MVAPSVCNCIWCGGPSDGAPPEHVIPEALGCPPGAELKEEQVCRPCNHGILANLDQALAASLDVIRWHAGVPGKKGKPPRVSTRSNFFAEFGNEGPVIRINFGPGEVVLQNGRVLKAPSKNANAVQAEMRVRGKAAVIRHRAKVLHHPDCSRALHKIALESIALTLGQEAVLDPSLDAARRYVMENRGSRQVLYLMPVRGWTYYNSLHAPYRSAEGYGVVFRLCGFEFIVDCTPQQSVLRRLKEQLTAKRGTKGWSWVPI